MSLKDYTSDGLLGKPVLETQRLTLRPMTIDDAPDLEAWLPDLALYTYWGRSAHKNELHPKERFIDSRPHIVRKPSLDFVWGMALKSNGKVIGEMCVINIENNRMAKVAYRLAGQYWGQGLTTEALRAAVQFCFEQTELQRLWSEVDARNIASRKVLEKCGFTREGLIRQGKMNLTYCDYYIYGMLKEDYTS
jgi:ribosomal-protein-alanine N-acetyltransferase